MIKVIWQPTREAAELFLANPDFKTYVDSFENADTSTQLYAQSEDQEIDNLTKQGYDNILWKHVGLVTRPKHQRQGTLYHRHCQSPSRHSTHLEMWDLGVGCGLLKPGFIKDSEGEPKIPEHITCQAACVYDIHGKCTGMLITFCYMPTTKLNGLTYTVLHNHLCKTRQLKL